MQNQLQRLIGSKTSSGTFIKENHVCGELTEQRFQVTNTTDERFDTFYN